MFKFLEKKLAESKEKKDLKENVNLLIEESRLSWKFVLFSILGAAMATLGIIMDNTTILIGAMLTAPLLVPIISLAVGIGAGSTKLITHSFKSLSIGFTLSIASAAGITLAFQVNEVNTHMYNSFSDAISYGIVAVIAGIIAVYSWFKPGTNNIIPGVAIAVALVPPIAFAGMLLALQNERFFIDVMQVIFFNLAGILVGGLITFVLYALFSLRPTAEVGKQVDKEVAKE